MVFIDVRVLEHNLQFLYIVCKTPYHRKLYLPRVLDCVRSTVCHAPVSNGVNYLDKHELVST